jgi:o-succinylbenzoate synthase
MAGDEPPVASIGFTVIEHELMMPFAIASGGMDTARAVITRVELDDGTVGIGESAPFPAVSGETVTSTLAALERVAARVRDIGEAAVASLADAPAARCGLEQALLDARLRAAGRSLADWLPPAVTTIETDITLPVAPTDAALAFVADVVGRGFHTLKVKIGGHALAGDVALLGEIHSTFPGLELLLDANAAYDLDSARELLARLTAARVPVALLEQPLGRAALDDMATLQAETDVPLCLDESLRGLDDLEAILARPALRSINIKTMKLGLAPAVEILRRAEEAGLTCMIGAMVESNVSITVSAAIAMHRPDVVHHVDLDTALFMRPGPVEGGVVYDGPRITMPGQALGHGCRLRS